MNKKIEELILAYLHRGSTPEQERELFEMCRDNPDISTYLREHLVMSLKLRQLRERTAVPEDAHNSLLRRINELEATAEPEVEEKRRTVAGFGFSPRWGQVFGSVLATAAVMMLLFFLVQGGWGSGSEEYASIPVIRDTVRQTVTDTVFQLREIDKPVYIVKWRSRETEPVTSPDPDSEDNNLVVAEENLIPEPATTIRPLPAHMDDTLTIAEVRAVDQPTYLEKYTEMVHSLEKVSLTSNDRIRF